MESQADSEAEREMKYAGKMPIKCWKHPEICKWILGLGLWSLSDLESFAERCSSDCFHGSLIFII